MEQACEVPAVAPLSTGHDPTRDPLHVGTTFFRHHNICHFEAMTFLLPAPPPSTVTRARQHEDPAGCRFSGQPYRVVVVSTWQ